MDGNKVLFNIINEEISKSEIASMIDSKISSKLSSKELEKRIKEITASVVSEVFKTLYQRNNLWKTKNTYKQRKNR